MSTGSNASTQPTNNASTAGNSTQQTASTDNVDHSYSQEGLPAPLNAPQAQITIQCEAIVETFCMGINPSKLDVLAQIIQLLAKFFNARPGHNDNFNNALWVYIEMLNNYENKQRVLHQEGANQLQARVGN